MVQAFRRDYSTVAATRYKLRGLDAAAIYEVQNFDTPGKIHVTAMS